MKKLLVIIQDRLSDLVKKGEITPLYYNPGNYFDEIHLIMTNDDYINPDNIKITVGDAKLYIYNIPVTIFNPFSVMKMQKKGIKIAQRVKPDIIRCYGPFINSFLGYHIKKYINKPLLVSLHINNDLSIRKLSLKRFKLIKWLFAVFHKYIIEKPVMKNADLLVPVYTSILPYIYSLNKKANARVLYNIIDIKSIKRKGDYSLHKPMRFLYTGRLIKYKNPLNIIKALENIEYDYVFDIYGDGPIKNELHKYIEKRQLSDKIKLKGFIKNSDILSKLCEYDIFLIHSLYHEISKTVLEAMAAGLPIILNNLKDGFITEYNKNVVLKVENAPESYRKAILFLIENKEERERLGHNAYNYYYDFLNANKMEHEWLEIFNKYIK